MKEKAKESADKAAEEAKGAKDRAAETAYEAKEKTNEKAHDLKKKLKDIEGTVIYQQKGYIIIRFTLCSQIVISNRYHG